MEIHHIFPQPVYMSKLERELTKDELNAMDKFRPTGRLTKTRQHLTRQSKEHYVLDAKELKNLKEDLNKIVVDYFEKVVCTSNSIFPHITQSWFNYTESKQHLHRHSHPNSFVSGVFYPAADKKSDKIVFFKEGYERIKLEYKKYNLYNSSSWTFPVETGNVILFPSHLIHGVNTKKGTNLRVSLAFNVFFKGYVGSSIDLTEWVLE